MNKKLEFCGNAVRCQVYEMWSQGDRVACGVITDDTKVKMCYLPIYCHTVKNKILLRSFFVHPLQWYICFYKCRQKCGILIYMEIYILRKL